MPPLLPPFLPSTLQGSCPCSSPPETRPCSENRLEKCSSLEDKPLVATWILGKMWKFYRSSCNKSWSVMSCLQQGQGTARWLSAERLSCTTSSCLACSADLTRVQKQGRPWEHGVFTLLEVCFKNLIPPALKLNHLAESP